MVGDFWDEAWWFLSLRVFGLLFSCFLLFPQHFGRHVPRPSSGVCQTREPTRNLKLHPLLKSRWGSPIQIPLSITVTSIKQFLYCYSPAIRIEPASSNRTHSVTIMGVGSLSFWRDNHLEVAGSVLTASG